MCTHTHKHIHTYVCTHTEEYAYAYICIHTNMYAHTYAHVYIHIHTCKYVWLYLCMCIYKYCKMSHVICMNGTCHIYECVTSWIKNRCHIWMCHFTHIDSQSLAECVTAYIRIRRRRLIESLKLQIIFRKTATKYRSLLRKMTYKDKGSYESRHTKNKSHHSYNWVISHIWMCQVQGCEDS